MQLRRDTEYALRILAIIGEKRTDRTSPGGVTLSEISAQSGVPRVGVDRICGYLESAVFIESGKGENGEVLYFPAAGFSDRSLLDVMQITEHGTQLFAVFDKSSSLFVNAGQALQSVQAGVERTLSTLTLADLMAQKKV